MKSFIVFICLVFVLPAVQPVQAAHNPYDAVIADGDDLQAFVTKNITLGPDYGPGDLVDLRDLGAVGMHIRAVVYPHLSQMMSDMRQAGLSPVILSAYRSFDYQKGSFARWSSRSRQAHMFSARAGHSQHQLGTAIDFGNANSLHNLKRSFGSTAEGQWLKENGWKYGFALSYPQNATHITGYYYEPWHYRFIGLEAARQWHESGLVLDQYLKTKPQNYIGDSLVGKPIKVPDDQTVFMVKENNIKQGIPTPEIFLLLGFDWEDILTVTKEQLAKFTIGPVIFSVD